MRGARSPARGLPELACGGQAAETVTFAYLSPFVMSQLSTFRFWGVVVSAFYTQTSEPSCVTTRDCHR